MWPPPPSTPVLIATTALLSAATTLLLCRRYARSLRLPTPSPAAPSSASAAASATPSATPTAPELSFLCTRCGTEPSPRASSDAPAQAGPVKMVILVRHDLNMSKGKAAAQCCHAVLAAYKTAHVRQPELLRRWERLGQPKITLKVDSDHDLGELMARARESGLTAESIRDAGHTQLASGTRTVCAIGPAPAKLVDLITGHLKLY